MNMLYFSSFFYINILWWLIYFLFFFSFFGWELGRNESAFRKNLLCPLPGAIIMLNMLFHCFPASRLGRLILIKNETDKKNCFTTFFKNRFLDLYFPRLSECKLVSDQWLLFTKTPRSLSGQRVLENFNIKKRLQTLIASALILAWEVAGSTKRVSPS